MMKFLSVIHKTWEQQTVNHRAVFFVLPFPLFVLAACSSSLQSETLNDPLVGCWQGEDFQPVLQKKAEWLMNRKPDGSFIIVFATLERGPIQREEGRWTHKDGKYTTVTTKIEDKPIDVSDPQYTDIYEVKMLDANFMTYHSTRMNLTFTSKKVACTKGVT
jgi:hypothetical protein